MLTKVSAQPGTPAPDGVFESVDDDDSDIDEAAFLDERFYAWQILLSAIERQTATSNAGLRRPDCVTGLIHEADEAGLGKTALIVELADMAAALAMRVHEDPFVALARVHDEMLAVWRERETR
jgi:hypothetical protein